MNSLSLNQIAYNILNTLRGGKTTYSEALNIEQIKHVVKYYRAMFIRRDAQRNFNRMRMFEQDLGFVELESVNSAEDDTISSGHNLKRTVTRIPTPVRLHRQEAITYITGSGQFDEPIPLLDNARSSYQKYNKFTSGEPFALYRDGYLYVDNDFILTKVRIRGVFEDPEQVHKFTRENGFDLYDADSPFPIAQDMLEGIVKGILQGELTIAVQTPQDTSTDKLQSGSGLQASN